MKAILSRGGWNKREPAPVKGGGDAVLPYVLHDLKERAAIGEEKYGTLLESHNGRDALIDAYQEALDLVMYLRQALLERDQ